MKYKYLEHTADAKFQAYGKTLKEGFINAALAMFNILFDPREVKPNIKKKIKISARKKESLLYDFLEELLFLLDTEGFLLNKIERMKISFDKEDYTLECVVYGDSHKDYDMRGNIKSITYNDMFIKEEEGKVVLQVVVDI